MDKEIQASYPVHLLHVFSEGNGYTFRGSNSKLFFFLSEKGFTGTLKGKDLLPMRAKGANYFLLE